MRNHLGTQLSDAERELAEVFETVMAILDRHGEDLAPYQFCNARRAAAALWQIVNGLDLDHEHPLSSLR